MNEMIGLLDESRVVELKMRNIFCSQCRCQSVMKRFCPGVVRSVWMELVSLCMIRSWMKRGFIVCVCVCVFALFSMSAIVEFAS